MGKKVVHVEFPAQDLDRAQRFWEGVGGWSIQDAGMPGIDYRMFQEGEQGGAVFPMENMQGPIVAVVPMRGPANVIVKTTIAPITAPIHIHGGERSASA